MEGKLEEENREDVKPNEKDDIGYRNSTSTTLRVSQEQSELQLLQEALKAQRIFLSDEKPLGEGSFGNTANDRR